MALREERDRINSRSFQCLLPPLLVELLPDAGKMRRGVEVEVNLAVTESVILALNVVHVVHVVHGDGGRSLIGISLLCKSKGNMG
jgi:hypothetical protein